MRDPYLEPVATTTSPSPSTEVSQGPDFDLSEYIDTVRRHWRILALGALLGTAAGLVQYFNTPESYDARTRVQIERRSSSPLGRDAYWAQPFWNPEFYPTQHEILKSRGLAQRVVEHLRLWEDPRYSAGGSTQPGSAAADEAFKGHIASGLRGGLTVKEVKGTQLFDIIYSAPEPELAMKIANGYAEAFIEYGKSERRDSASTASGFLTDEINGLKKEIADKEFQLQQYSRETNLVNIDPSSNVTLQRLDAVNRDYIKARTDRIQAEARYNEMLKAPKETIADPLSGGVVTDLRGQLISKEREYATKLKTYKPDFPAMTQLNSEIDELRSELQKIVEEMANKGLDSARSAFQTARRAENGLEQELRKLKDESLEVSSASVEYRNLKSEIENRRTLLQQLQRQQSETDVAVRGSDQSTIRQVDRALLPGRPAAPNLEKSASGGGAIGFFIAVGLVLLIELLDRSVKTPEELEKRTGLPTLAVIPDILKPGKGYGYSRFYGSPASHRAYGYNQSGKKNRKSVQIELVPFTSPTLAVSEAYRSLRTALLLSSASEVKVVGVTSCSAGEGKTSTSANLAIVMAQLGKRVLLIDADMRKPRCHQVLGTSNRAGLVSFLVGRNSIEECLQTTKISNLVLCPSGPTPPNPSELISSERMRYLVRQARSQFDLVIIDTPPTLAVTDSTLVGSMSDGMVLCVRAGRVPRDAIKTCRDRLQMAGVKILGTVLNGFRTLPGGYYKTHSYHYEAYGEYARRQKEGAVA